MGEGAERCNAVSRKVFMITERADRYIDYNAVRLRIGIKDLICPRKALWNYKMTLKEYIELYDEIVESKMMYGIGVHSFKNILRIGCEKEVPVEICGRKFYADYVCSDGNRKYVVEIKTKVKSHEWDVVRWQVYAYANALNIEDVLVISVVDNKAYWLKAEWILDKVCEHMRLVEEGKDVPNRGPWCVSCIFRRKCYNAKLV